METLNRRYDIDWLRVISIGLLLIYHIAIAFQPWGFFIGFIQNPEPINWIWYPMSMLNMWRIPMLFYVSGMGVAFALRKRTWLQLLAERTRRILVPLIFGMLAIVPLHILLKQSYYDSELAYLPNTGHLWFLWNIFLYVVLMLPLFYLLEKQKTNGFAKKLTNLFASPLGFLVVIAVFIAEAVLVNPYSFEFYAIGLHGYVLGFLAFFFGFIIIQSGESFWKTSERYRWVTFALATALYIVRLVFFDMKAPNILASAESNLWVFSVFGFGYRYLNRPNDILQYLSKAAYPVYIIHMVFLYLASYFIFPLEIPVGVKIVLVTVGNAIGCFVVYHFIIQRFKVIRPLFGVK